MNPNVRLMVAAVGGALFGGLIGVETVVALLLGAGAAWALWRIARNKTKIKS